MPSHRGRRPRPAALRRPGQSRRRDDVALILVGMGGIGQARQHEAQAQVVTTSLPQCETDIQPSTILLKKRNTFRTQIVNIPVRKIIDGRWGIVTGRGIDIRHGCAACHTILSEHHAANPGRPKAVGADGRFDEDPEGRSAARTPCRRARSSPGSRPRRRGCARLSASRADHFGAIARRFLQIDEVLDAVARCARNMPSCGWVMVALARCSTPPATAPTALQTSACGGIDQARAQSLGDLRIIAADRRADRGQRRVQLHARTRISASRRLLSRDSERPDQVAAQLPPVMRIDAAGLADRGIEDDLARLAHHLLHHVAAQLLGSAGGFQIGLVGRRRNCRAPSSAASRFQWPAGRAHAPHRWA